MRRRKPPVDPTAPPIELTRMVITDWITSANPAPARPAYHADWRPLEWLQVNAAKRWAAAKRQWEATHNHVPSTFIPGAAAPQPSPKRNRSTHPLPEVRATRGNHAGNPGAGETL